MKTTQLMAGLMAISMVASPVAFAQSGTAAPSSGMSEQGAGYNSEQRQTATPQQPMQPRTQGQTHAAPKTMKHDGHKQAHEGMQTQHQSTHNDGHALVSGTNATNAPLAEVKLDKGGKLPQNYRLKQYVVDDWKGHGLSAPAKSQHWVQVGAHYALVNNAGVIAQVHGQ